MRNILLMLGLALSISDLVKAQETPPRHEIGLTLGRLSSQDRSGGNLRLTLQSGTALQANYGYRFFGQNRVALYGEVHLLASPLRDIVASDPSLTRNAATLFVTPGIRVKVFPGRNVAPYFAIGAGWANYEQSTTTLAGAPNPASRSVNHAVFDYGGGVDFRFWRFIGLRAEVRDFYAGAPSYNTTLISGGQHNLVAGGGLVLRFR